MSFFYIFQNSDKGIRLFLPTVLNRTLSIVEGSARKIDSVIDGFNSVENILNEIYQASLAKQGETEELRRQVLARKKQKELEKRQKENRIKRQNDEIEKLNNHITDQTELFEKAQEELNDAEINNSEEKSGKWVHDHYTLQIFTASLQSLAVLHVPL